MAAHQRSPIRKNVASYVIRSPIKTLAVHIAAVLLMLHLIKDNLILAMTTGKRRADGYPEARDAMPPARLVILIAAIAVGTALWRYSN